MGDLNVKVTAILDKAASERNIRKSVNEIAASAKLKFDTSSATKAVRQFNAELERSLAKNKLAIYMKNNAFATKNSAAELKRLGDLAKNLSNSSDVSNWNKEFRNLTGTVKALGKDGTSAFASMGKEAKKFFNWIVASGGVMLAVQQLKQLVKNVVDLDTAMTELRKTTDETEASYAAFVKRTSVTATQIGSTITDLVSATAEFSRTGYGLADSEELAKVATIYKNVGDGIDSVSDSSSVLISILKSFNLEAEDSLHIVDALNLVGNKYAVGSNGLGQALLRSSSALAAANNTFEESLGLITAADEIIQDPDVTGTAIKTISMRLRNTAGELEELGEDSEGAAESVTKLQTQLLNLTSGKVDIMSDSDTFKSTYDILVELSKVYDDLTDKQQADVTRLVAGTRQGNVFNALMSNLKNGVNATTDALNSNGSAIEENDKYLNSINGKISQLTASFQKLSTNTLNSGTVKFFIDLATGVTDATDKIGLFRIALVALAGVFSKTKNIGISIMNMPYPTIYYGAVA